MPHEKLPDMIREHDVYLLASREEGGPLTLLESMSLGLVPVCGDIEGLVKKLVGGRCGFRVQGDMPDAYAAAIDRLHHDRRLLEEMSAEARALIVSDFNAESMARRYMSLLPTAPTAPASTQWPEQMSVLPMLHGPAWMFGRLGRILRRMRKRLLN